MNQHVGDTPMVGYFVQRRAKAGQPWENYSCTWDTYTQARAHQTSIDADLGGESRICKCTHEPIG